MDIEKKVVKLLVNQTDIVNGELYLYEEAPDDKDVVQIDLIYNDCKISLKRENFFSALVVVRRI